MSYVGINIGALTVKVAALRGGARSATVLAHQGRPLEILHEILAGPEFADAEYFGVSGQLGHISEVAAVQRGLRERACPFSPMRATATPSPRRCSDKWTSIFSRCSNMRPETM